MANVLEQEMHSYFTQLNEEEKKSVIQMLKAFLKSRKSNLSRITIEQYNKELDEAVEQIEAGNFVTQEELEKEIEEW